MILAPNRNIWRLERAERAAILIDAARYFGALREALIKARSSVFVIGWDLDSRTRLVGESGPPPDHYPETFVEFLSALVQERPQLLVHLLVWDYSILYALEREPFPTMSLGWRTPPRIRYCLDDDLPPGGWTAGRRSPWPSFLASGGRAARARMRRPCSRQAIHGRTP